MKKAYEDDYELLYLISEDSEEAKEVEKINPNYIDEEIVK